MRKTFDFCPLSYGEPELVDWWNASYIIRLRFPLSSFREAENVGKENGASCENAGYGSTSRRRLLHVWAGNYGVVEGCQYRLSQTARIQRLPLAMSARSCGGWSTASSLHSTSTMLRWRSKSSSLPSQTPRRPCCRRMMTLTLRWRKERSMLSGPSRKLSLHWTTSGTSVLPLRAPQAEELPASD